MYNSVLRCCFSSVRIFYFIKVTIIIFNVYIVSRSNCLPCMTCVLLRIILLKIVMINIVCIKLKNSNSQSHRLAADLEKGLHAAIFTCTYLKFFFTCIILPEKTTLMKLSPRHKLPGCAVISECCRQQSDVWFCCHHLVLELLLVFSICMHRCSLEIKSYDG